MRSNQRCAGPGKSIQGFKFKRAGGRSELIRGIAGGDQNRKKYFSGWCQFIKLAKAFDGYVIKFREYTARTQTRRGCSEHDFFLTLSSFRSRSNLSQFWAGCRSWYLWLQKQGRKGLRTRSWCWLGRSRSTRCGGCSTETQYYISRNSQHACANIRWIGQQKRGCYHNVVDQKGVKYLIITLYPFATKDVFR